MIVLEGPDGSGKTTLLANLLDQFPGIQEHARASASVGGPLPEIHDWANYDLATQMLQPLSFYDRHPIFSEPIYGRIIRNHVHDWFTSEPAQAMGQEFIENNLIVVCLPPIENVIENIQVEDQMAGVLEHIHSIYEVYKTMLTGLAQAFPKNIFHYDYTVETDLEELVDVVTAHQIRFNRKQTGRIA